MVLVGDVMSRDLVCVAPTDPATRARSMIRRHGFRVLPVVDDGRLVGVISRADVLRVTSGKANIKVEGIMDRDTYTVSPQEEVASAARKIVSSGKKQLLVADGNILGIISSLDVLTALAGDGSPSQSAMVGEVMSPDVVSCASDELVSSVWGKIEASGFSGLPVVSGKKVVGMVTRMDLLKKGKARISRESGRSKNMQVKKVMNAPAVTINDSCSVADAAKLMVERRILRLPVMGGGGELVGIVDVEDVLGAYAGR
ncbi:MAG: CBS domain-containing protein [Candidatus Altiarchaeota archaeon]